jgi:hypothetical protein
VITHESTAATQGVLPVGLAGCVTAAGSTPRTGSGGAAACTGAATASAVPQLAQKRAPSGFSVPHFEQNMTHPSSGHHAERGEPVSTAELGTGHRHQPGE